MFRQLHGAYEGYIRETRLDHFLTPTTDSHELVELLKPRDSDLRIGIGSVRDDSGQIGKHNYNLPSVFGRSTACTVAITCNLNVSNFEYFF